MSRGGRRGVTMIEMVVGFALAAVIGLVLARMFSVLLRASLGTARQTAVLASSRKALVNTGPHRGMVWAAQEASSVRSLSTSTLELGLPQLSTYTYTVSETELLKTQDGSSSVQATGISSMTLSYFEIDSTGRIFASTVASQASYVQIRMTVSGKTGRDRVYHLISGAWLRNK